MILAGEANAYCTLWHSTNPENTRGADLLQEIDDSSFGVLNAKHPTRLPKGDQPSSPNISLASSDLLLDLTWKTEITLGSDHLPLKIELKRDTETRAPKRTFVNSGEPTGKASNRRQKDSSSKKTGRLMPTVERRSSGKSSTQPQLTTFLVDLSRRPSQTFHLKPLVS